MHFDDFEALYDYVIDAGQEADDFDALPESVRILYVVEIFNVEIMNGGLCQFFVNEGVELAPLVSAALRAVGFAKGAELYEAFLSENRISLFDMESFRIDDIEEYEDQTERYPFDDFDDEYYDLCEELDVEQLMLDYANAHAEDFED